MQTDRKSGTGCVAGRRHDHPDRPGVASHHVKLIGAPVLRVDPTTSFRSTQHSLGCLLCIEVSASGLGFRVHRQPGIRYMHRLASYLGSYQPAADATRYLGTSVTTAGREHIDRHAPADHARQNSATHRSSSSVNTTLRPTFLTLLHNSTSTIRLLNALLESPSR